MSPTPAPNQTSYTSAADFQAFQHPRLDGEVRHRDSLTRCRGLRDYTEATLCPADCVIGGEAVDGLEAVRLAGEYKPDIAVVDFSMPRLDGLDAARQIRKESPETKILMLTMHDAAPAIGKIQEAGIHGYL